MQSIPKRGSPKEPKGIVLIDFSKAYDRVDRDKLYEILEEMKVEKNSLNLLKVIHNNSYTSIGGIRIRLKKGLPQGSVLSPHLFNLFIDSLIRRMETINGDVWAFADDLAFGFKSRKEYNDKCKIIDDWCLQFKMKLNENKCEVMIRNSRTAVLDSKFRKVETIRYLGVHIAKNLSLKPHLESMKTKIDYISYKINMISRQIIRPNRLITWFFVLMKSVMDYGSEIYLVQPFKTVKEGIIMLIKKVFKRTLRLKKGTLDKVIWQLIGRPEDEWRRKMIRIRDDADLTNNVEYQDLLRAKKMRRELRKKVNWHTILVASTPFGAAQKCKLCGKFNVFSHIKEHCSIEDWNMLIMVKDITIREDSIIGLLGIEEAVLIRFWRIYRDTFNETIMKEPKNELNINA